MRCIALVLLLACGAASAQDPLKSGECGSRLTALDAARALGDAGRVEASRRAATQACLGGSGAAHRPAPAAQAPAVVPPPVIEPPSATAVRVPPPPPLPQPVPPPTFVTHCDLGGCWDNAGRRLNGTGPTPVGPAGACTAAGGLVHCP